MNRANNRDHLGLDLVPLAIATVLASAAGYVLVASQVNPVLHDDGEAVDEFHPGSVRTVQGQQSPGDQP